MLNLKNVPLATLLAALFCAAFVISPAKAQSARSALEIYDEGPVWHMIYVRTGSGHREAYLDSLSRTWKRQVELAEKKGFVLRHHILTKWPNDPEDWDVLIIEVFPNMASYDSFWEDWAKVDTEILNDRREEKVAAEQVSAVRTMLGVQIAREVLLKAPESR